MPVVYLVTFQCLAEYQAFYWTARIKTGVMKHWTHTDKTNTPSADLEHLISFLLIKSRAINFPRFVLPRSKILPGIMSQYKSLNMLLSGVSVYVCLLACVNVKNRVCVIDSHSLSFELLLPVFKQMKEIAVGQDEWDYRSLCFSKSCTAV